MSHAGQFLDLRGLPPPQPMERILAALETLPQGQCLHALTPQYPAPLLPLLEAQGFACRAQAVDGGARVLVCHAHDPHLLDATPAA